MSAVFEPKSVLITGGAGFIASHVVLKLVKSHPNTKVRSALMVSSSRVATALAVCEFRSNTIKSYI